MQRDSSLMGLFANTNLHSLAATRDLRLRLSVCWQLCHSGFTARISFGNQHFLCLLAMPIESEGIQDRFLVNKDIYSAR